METHKYLFPFTMSAIKKNVFVTLKKKRFLFFQHFRVFLGKIYLIETIQALNNFPNFVSNNNIQVNYLNTLINK